MSCKLSDMKRVSVRELQRHLKDVLERVERGESIEVTKRNRVIGRLSPVAVASPESTEWPDLEARSEAVFGRRKIEPPPSEQVGLDRGDR